MTAAKTDLQIDDIVLRVLSEKGPLSDTSVYQSADQEFLSLTIMTLIDLEQRGMVEARMINSAPLWQITAKGLGWIESARQSQERRAKEANHCS